MAIIETMLFYKHAQSKLAPIRKLIFLSRLNVADSGARRPDLIFLAFSVSGSTLLLFADEIFVYDPKAVRSHQQKRLFCADRQ